MAVNNKSYIVLLLQLAQTFLAAIISIYIARLLGAQEYGRYIYLITIASFLPLLLGLGAEHVFIMEASKKPKLISVFFGNAILIRSLLSLFTLIIIYFILLLLQIEDFLVIMLIISGSLLAVFPNPLFISLYRVKGIHIRPWLLYIFGPSVFILYLLLLGDEHPDIVWVSLGFFISQMSTLVLFLFDIRRIVKLKVSMHYIIKYFKTGMIFSVSQGFDFAFARLDIFILEYTLGSYAVGIYSAGQKLVSLLLVIPSSFHIVELPEFHRLSDNKNLLIDKFRSLRKLLFELGILFFGLISINASFIINLLYGNEFAAASNIVIVLSAAGLVLFVNYPYYMLAEAINKIKSRMRLRIVTFFVTGVLVYLFINFYGLIGAAIGIFIGQLIFIILLHNLTQTHNGRFSSIIVDGRMILIAIIAIGLSIYVQSMFENAFVVLLTGSVSYVLLFMGIGHQLKWLETTHMITKIWIKYFG